MNLAAEEKIDEHFPLAAAPAIGFVFSNDRLPETRIRVPDLEIQTITRATAWLSSTPRWSCGYRCDGTASGLPDGRFDTPDPYLGGAVTAPAPEAESSHAANVGDIMPLVPQPAEVKNLVPGFSPGSAGEEYPSTISPRVEDPATWGRYTYVEGDPVNRFDRTGLYSTATCEALRNARGVFAVTFLAGVIAIKYIPGGQWPGFAAASLGAAGWWITGNFIQAGC